MIRGIYSAATGMMASEQSLDVITNNLANMSTNGYKRDGITFADAYAREMRSNGGMGAVLGTVGSGPVESGRFTCFEPGPLTTTGNPLDIAIDGPAGAFGVEVQQPDGSTKTSYTRDGSFELNSQRQIVTKAGYPVLDSSGRPITLAQNGVVNVNTDGTVMLNGQTVGKIAVFSGTFMKNGPNLFSPLQDATGKDVNPPTVIDKPTLKVQTVEGSNVNAIDSMGKMITINRTYELSQKSIQKQDELTDKLIQSLQNSQ